jgi:hypothetical protein
MKPARTHTYPVCRLPIHAACQHRKIWAYTHSRLTDNDIATVARAFGITVNDLLETAQERVLRQLNR